MGSDRADVRSVVRCTVVDGSPLVRDSSQRGLQYSFDPGPNPSDVALRIGLLGDRGRCRLAHRRQQLVVVPPSDEHTATEVEKGELRPQSVRGEGRDLGAL